MTTRRWRRRIAVFFVALGGVMIAAPMSMAVAADTASDVAGSIGFFEVSGQAKGIGLEFGDPNAGGSPYPLAAGLVPFAQSQFSGGPSGRALSSIQWPGDLVANAGTLAGLVGVPLPADVLANGNYPVKAEASASGGGRDEQSLGAMTAIVDDKQSIARTALSDFGSPAVVSAARIVTRTRSYNSSETGSEAETILQDVEIGGQVRIESIRTLAKAITTGDTATLTHEVTVEGVTVGGQGATIDHEGMHVGPSSNPNPADELVKGFNEGFAEGGFEAFVTKPVENQSTGGAGSITSGAVVFVWRMGDSGQQFVVTLGGATASVQATPGSGALGGDDVLSGTGTGTFDPVGGGGFSSPIDLDTTASFGSGGSSSGGGGGSNIVPADEVLGFETVSSLTDRVPLGWMLIGMAGMFMIGMGLAGFRAGTIDALQGTACPLERGVL